MGLHDTLLFTAFSTALSGWLVAMRIPSQKYALLTLTAILSATFSAFGLVSPKPNYPAPPILKTIWFELHVLSAFVSYGLFGVSALLAALKLWKDRQNQDTEELFKFQYRCSLLGYLLFSFSMITGGVWAHLAWGTYWIWTPKELWTAVLWLSYALYLHLRLEPRPFLSKERLKTQLSWWNIGSYGVVLFTYLGVGLLMRSSHSF